MLTHGETQRYSRHLMLPEIGAQGQTRLKESRVLLVGAGGLGSAVAPYLAAAGVGTLVIVDPDSVELSNLQRQVMHGESTLGAPKVQSAAMRLRDVNSNVCVLAHAQALTSGNARALSDGCDVVIDGTDNFTTRYLINDTCTAGGMPWIYASIQGFDGQVSVFDAARGPCYRCLFPAAPPGDLAPNCADAGVLGVMPGVMGLLQATEALKLLLGQGDTLVGRLLHFDALSMRFYDMALDKDPLCVVCGPHSNQPANPKPLEARTMAQNNDVDITPAQLAGKLKSGKLTLVDVREQHEWDIGHIEGATLIPLGQIEARAQELNLDDDIVLYCKMGGRSRRALDILQARGFKKLSNLAGGILAYSRDVDPRIPQY